MSFNDEVYIPQEAMDALLMTRLKIASLHDRMCTVWRVGRSDELDAHVQEIRRWADDASLAIMKYEITFHELSCARKG